MLFLLVSQDQAVGLMNAGSGRNHGSPAFAEDDETGKPVNRGQMNVSPAKRSSDPGLPPASNEKAPER